MKIKQLTIITLYSLRIYNPIETYLYVLFTDRRQTKIWNFELL